MPRTFMTHPRSIERLAATGEALGARAGGDGAAVLRRRPAGQDRAGPRLAYTRLDPAVEWPTRVRSRRRFRVIHSGSASVTLLGKPQR